MDATRDWFQSNWFGVVGILSGVAVAIGVALWQRRPSILDYRVMILSALLSQHASRLNVPLTINYLKNPMKNPHLIRIRITNTGRQAVRAEDYVQPITLEVVGAEVYDMFIPSESTPGLINLGKDTASTPSTQGLNSCTFSPKLLNPGDWFEVQEVCEGKPQRIVVSCRFANQTRPMAASDLRRRSINRRIVSGVVISAFIVSITLGFVLGWENPLWLMPVVAVLGAGGPAVIRTALEESAGYVRDRARGRKARGSGPA